MLRPDIIGSLVAHLCHYQQIEWIKGLLAVPFVLLSQPTAAYFPDGAGNILAAKKPQAQQRYAQIMRDVEDLINDHIAHQKKHPDKPSKLKILVPLVSSFFTPLRLEKAFFFQDEQRRISSRRFVGPSFNDVRLILNTAQVMSLVEDGPIQLVTFDGDVTLYHDGGILAPGSPIVSKLLVLLAQGTKVAIVTAAGYVDNEGYSLRFSALFEEVFVQQKLGALSDPGLIIVGGESNYLITYDRASPLRMKRVPRREWMLPEMLAWMEHEIEDLLCVAREALTDCITNLGLAAQIVRKERAIGIIPIPGSTVMRFTREQLEETVLVTQQKLDLSNQRLPFCVFNGGVAGGNDVFVDIGDKRLGVMVCQKYFGGIEGKSTLHVGDQFLSAGANDFKARLACTTAWIASPEETAQLLDELQAHRSRHEISQSPVKKENRPLQLQKEIGKG
ncbi:IMP 5'-nucleotidase [Agyrium rufum]|nr:IMP 5'-nucleotidase [Agyrium rufum]